MSTALSTTITVQVQATLTKAMDMGTAQDPLSLTRTVSLADGTGADQADRSFHDQRTLAASASEELDVAGVLTDAFGTTVSLARVKALLVRNLSADDSLLIGGAAANALGLFADASDVLKLRPGGIFLVSASDVDGVAVGADDKLKMAHSGDTTTSLDYEIVLIGASA